MDFPSFESEEDSRRCDSVARPRFFGVSADPMASLLNTAQLNLVTSNVNALILTWVLIFLKRCRYLSGAIFYHKLSKNPSGAVDSRLLICLLGSVIKSEKYAKQMGRFGERMSIRK